MRTLAAGLVLGLVACNQVPARVLVPGAPFRHVVRISTGQGDRPTVVVGQPLKLHATRESGPWIEKPGSEAPPDGCWVASFEPHEPEVAAMLTWRTEPSGSAAFDLPRPDTIAARTREVRFSKAGEYQLSALSALPCSRQVSNTITISVRER